MFTVTQWAPTDTALDVSEGAVTPDFDAVPGMKLDNGHECIC